MASPEPRLITTREAAALLGVSPRTILNWIQDDAIPYISLPSRGGHRHEYRIPLHGLLRSVSGNYDLAAEFHNADALLTEHLVASPASQRKLQAEPG